MRVRETRAAWSRGVAAFVGAVICVAVSARAFERYEVRGRSMEPALLAGDRLLLLRTRRVRPGDVAVLRDPRAPERLVAKRIAGGGATRTHVVVLGDNAAASTDSRSYGRVPRRLVRGRVLYRYAPAGRTGRLRRPTPAA